MSKVKKEVAEQIEKIDAMGQEDEIKAAKWVIEEQKEVEKKENRELAETEEKLHDARRRVFTYKDALLNEFKRRMVTYDIPQNFIWNVYPTKKGIALYFRDRQSHWYGKGMKVCGDPRYDLNCLERMLIGAVSSMDSIASVMEKENITKSGIILPN